MRAVRAVFPQRIQLLEPVVGQRADLFFELAVQFLLRFGKAVGKEVGIVEVLEDVKKMHQTTSERTTGLLDLTRHGCVPHGSEEGLLYITTPAGMIGL